MKVLSCAKTITYFE